MKHVTSSGYGWTTILALCTLLSACAPPPPTVQHDNTADAGKLNWMDDFAAAARQAEENGKVILVNFTGSDWCGWCIKLDNEVFSQPAFAEFADSHFVLFKADFPRSFELAEAVQVQNEHLMRQYKIQGFPTILLLNPDGTVRARTGYQPGGVQNYIDHLNTLRVE